MFIPRSLLCVRHAASTDETRHNLRSVHFEWDDARVTAVATNGHIMAVAEAPAEPDVFPDVGQEPPRRGGHPGSQTVPADLVGRIVKAIPRQSRRTLPYCRGAFLDSGASMPGTHQVWYVHGGESAERLAEPSDLGDFPQWRQIAKRAGTGEPLEALPRGCGFNPEYLATIAPIFREYAQHLQRLDPEDPRHRKAGPLNAAVFGTGEGCVTVWRAVGLPEGHALSFYLMPVRI